MLSRAQLNFLLVEIVSLDSFGTYSQVVVLFQQILKGAQPFSASLRCWIHRGMRSTFNGGVTVRFITGKCSKAMFATLVPDVPT